MSAMLAARDQENLVHTQQTTAAAKPLNQSTRQLQPKTPGKKLPKTPFRIPINDENNPLAFGGGKQTVRGPRPGNENFLRPGKDGLQKQSLVTPLGLRNRAPLGMKTTNARTRAFQTPGPRSGNAKPLRTVKRSSTARKIKQAPAPPVTQVEPKEWIEEDEDRDIEYMPPKPTPLPDHPDDIIYDTTFPQFKGRNFARGWETLYQDNEVGPDGLTKKQREEKKASDDFDKHVEGTLRNDFDNMELLGINVRESPDEPCAEEIAQMKLQEMQNEEGKKFEVERQIPTINSRSAAQALAFQPRTIQTRSMTGAAPKARFPSVFSSRKKAPLSTNPSPMRHTAAVVNSKTTIGYSAGRKVASTLRGGTKRDSTDDVLSPQKYIELYGEPVFGTEMWLRCKAAGCFDTEPNRDDELLAAEATLPPYEEDEESANFQLTLSL